MFRRLVVSMTESNASFMQLWRGERNLRDWVYALFFHVRDFSITPNRRGYGRSHCLIRAFIDSLAMTVDAEDAERQPALFTFIYALYFIMSQQFRLERTYDRPYAGYRIILQSE